VNNERCGSRSRMTTSDGIWKVDSCSVGLIAVLPMKGMCVGEMGVRGTQRRSGSCVAPVLLSQVGRDWNDIFVEGFWFPDVVFVALTR
jgi:hypothetical protein